MTSDFSTSTAAPQYVVEHMGKTVIAPSGALQILRDINLTLHKGDTLAIVGASGSGKSTLLHILGALDTPTEGTVLYDGVPLTSLSAEGRAAFRNKELGFVFQFHHLLPEFNTLENVAMQALVGGMKKSEAFRLAEEALNRVGLAERRDHKVTTLSGGERQRAAIARAILMRPNVLLADEPTGNLDEHTGERVVQLLLELNQSLGMTLVVVTHNREMAARMGSCLEMRSGELYA